MGEFGSSDLGRKRAAEKPPAINVKFLKRFPAYCDFIGSRPRRMMKGFQARRCQSKSTEPRLKLIDAAYKSLREATAEVYCPSSKPAPRRL